MKQKKNNINKEAKMWKQNVVVALGLLQIYVV